MTDAERRSIAPGLALWSLLGVTLVLIAVFAIVKKTPEQTAAPPEKRAPVRVVALEQRDLPDVLALPGHIEPFAEARLGAEKPGRVSRIDADRGARVEAGQRLMQLDDSLWVTGLRRAEIEHREALKELARWQALKETGAVSDSSFDGVSTRVDLAEAALEEYRVHVARCRVLSPFAGIVNDRFVEEGEYANEGAPLVQVVNFDTVKLTVDVPERDIPAVAEGDGAPFSVASLQNRVFTGTVAFVSVRADPRSNAYRVEVLADNPGRILKPGMIAEVSLTRPRHKQAVVVPLAVVMPRKGEHVVFVEEDGHAALRVVKIGAIVGHEAVVSEGLRPGDRIIVEGHRALEDGQAIEILP